MGNGGLDTGCFDEDGRWRKYKEAQNYRSGPSPWPLLIVALLIALVMLLRGGAETAPQEDVRSGFVLTNIP